MLGLSLALVGAALCGCQSTNFKAASLPMELRAAPITGTKQIHLPNLAASGVGTSAISPGDLLDVTIFSGLEDEAPNPSVLQVSQRGDIDLPLIGQVVVAGMEPSDASRAITSAAVDRGVYRRPNVTLEINKRATHQITVLGAVSEPGVHELPVGACDVLSAISAAGGLTEDAGTEVEVMRQPAKTFLARGGPGNAANPDIQQVAYQPGFQPPAVVATRPQPATAMMERIDLAMADTKSTVSQPLGDRDVIRVPPQTKRIVYVSGLVNKPDQFELPHDQNVRVLDALAMAGGLSSVVADKVYVIRQFEDDQRKQPAVIQVSIADAKQNGKENLILAPGDLVSVESTVTTTFVGAIESFFRISLGVTNSAFGF